MMTRLLLATLLTLLVRPVAAQTIYKCTDEHGGTLISNTKVNKNCKAVSSSPESSVPAPKARPSGAAANPTPAGFPRVQEDTQTARDTDRQRILEQEMTGEQRNLEQAKKELVEQEAPRSGDDKNQQRAQERLQPYKDRISQHERNIQAIQKELGKLR